MTFWIRWASARRTVSKARHLCLTQCKFCATPCHITSNKVCRIMFMREYTIIDSAVSQEQLRLRLKDTELEKYGEQFTPEFVYDVIKRQPRFSHMRVSFALLPMCFQNTNFCSVVTNKMLKNSWVSFWLAFTMNVSTL